MKIVHRFRIMIDVFVFDVCLIRAKIWSEMMLFARMTAYFALKIAFIRAKMGSKMVLFARMTAYFALKMWFHSGENGVKDDAFRPNACMFCSIKVVSFGRKWG